MVRVLIADKMDAVAREIFKARGVEVVEKPGLSSDELSAIIGEFDGLAVRSATKVTADNLARAGKLRVIGRAGIGVDTIDVPAATRAGVVVMNTPFGNSTTTAEHALAMMMAMARQIPQASASTHAGKWEKSAFMGVELAGKVLGVIGCGNIGAIVADRAIGLKMRVIAFDPFLSEARALELGVQRVALDELYAQADFITLHTPMTDKTRGMVNAAAFAKMKKGVRIINCARGGLIVEADLKVALDAGQVAAAALDVFEVEPAKENVLFGHPNVICTPHLGASTSEAQENVARQIAEQMSDFLLGGAVSNAVNMPAISAEDAPRLRPYMDLATLIGKFAAQISDDGFDEVSIEYQGRVSGMNTKPLTACVLSALLSQMSDSVNMVNAAEVAKAKGLSVREVTGDACAAFGSAINLVVSSKGVVRNVMGTLFAGTAPRIVEIEGVAIEAAATPHMLFIRNHDKPGMIGALGTVLAGANQNIADFRLGRQAAGGVAVSLVSLDAPLPDPVFEDVRKISQIKDVRRLSF